MEKNPRSYFASAKLFVNDRLFHRAFKSYARLIDLVISNIKPAGLSVAQFKEDPAIKFLRSGGRFFKSSLLSFCVLNTLITVVGYPACIYGKSMQPEFNASTGWREYGARVAKWKSSFIRLDLDWVWVSCWRARDFSFDRGDIVVFVSPKEPYDYVIKRVIGLEGDTVTSHQHSRIRVKIPEGHCWVEGDNWHNSVDSNKYGPISKGLIFGVATHVIWPMHRWRGLEPEIPEDLEPERVELSSLSHGRSR